MKYRQARKVFLVSPAGIAVLSTQMDLKSTSTMIATARLVPSIQANAFAVQASFRHIATAEVNRPTLDLWTVAFLCAVRTLPRRSGIRSHAAFRLAPGGMLTGVRYADDGGNIVVWFVPHRLPQPPVHGCRRGPCCICTAIG